jgi:Raf kinase inhibitor-like YbhB/YbcL family protein
MQAIFTLATYHRASHDAAMRTRAKRAVVAGALVGLAACGGGNSNTAVDPAEPTASIALQVTSTAFAAGAEIPAELTCEGANTSPPLAWSGAPPATKGYAIVVDDPDAPGKTWVHWVLANVPASTTSLAAGASAGDAGKTDFGSVGYGGPCPPIGRHRYRFKVYALDAVPLGAPGQTKAELLAAIAGHVIALGELDGTYQKHAR